MINFNIQNPSEYFCTLNHFLENCSVTDEGDLNLPQAQSAKKLGTIISQVIEIASTWQANLQDLPQGVRAIEKLACLYKNAHEEIGDIWLREELINFLVNLPSSEGEGWIRWEGLKSVFSNPQENPL